MDVESIESIILAMMVRSGMPLRQDQMHLVYSTKVEQRPRTVQTMPDLGPWPGGPARPMACD